MEFLKRLNVSDMDMFKEDITRFIYESFAMSVYMDSFTLEDANTKFKQLEAYEADGKAVVFGYIEDQQLCGFVWAYEYPFREDENRLYVSILHVDAECRNRHIGDMLLKAVEGYGAEHGYGAVYLHAEGHNGGAQRFYGRMGYAPERVQLVKKLN